jgi:hypothetical protein
VEPVSRAAANQDGCGHAAHPSACFFFSSTAHAVA